MMHGVDWLSIVHADVQLTLAVIRPTGCRIVQARASWTCASAVIGWLVGLSEWSSDQSSESLGFVAHRI